ncbi:MAG: response regulator [Candidatus Omnitrophota bacterium]
MVKKILIADDEQEVVDILTERLQREGFEVLVSRTGHEALIQTRAHMPDLILMDIVLPDMDGSEAVRDLHDHPATTGIPVIFLSGIIAGQDDFGSSGITVGGRHYEAIGKPFTYSDLRSRIGEMLQLTE